MSESNVKGGVWEFLRALVDSPNLLLILGPLSIVLGAAGGITYNQWLPVEDKVWRGLLGALGVMVLIGGFYRSSRTSTAKLTKAGLRAIGVKINSPSANEIIVGQVDVRGSIAKQLPDGYDLWIFRGYPNGRYVPIFRANFDYTDTKSWSALQVDLGADTGERRFIEAWLVGSDGVALIDTYFDALAVHHDVTREYERRVAGAKATRLRPIKPFTSDMHKVGSVAVTRG